MRDWSELVSNEGLDTTHRVGWRCRAPLLELDDDRVFSTRGVVTREKRIEAPARVAQLVFEDQPVVVELRLVQQQSKRGQGIRPRVNFGWTRLVAELGDVFDAQLLGDPMHLRIYTELLGGRCVELHLGG